MSDEQEEKDLDELLAEHGDLEGVLGELLSEERCWACGRIQRPGFRCTDEQCEDSDD